MIEIHTISFAIGFFAGIVAVLAIVGASLLDKDDKDNK